MGLWFAADVFFVSPRVLRGPSTDRPETLSHDRKLAEIYNPSPKLPPPPKKNGGQKHAKFRSILYNPVAARGYFPPGANVCVAPPPPSDPVAYLEI